MEQNYDRYKNTPHKQFRDDYVDPGMDNTLQRAGVLNQKGIKTVTDIYTGRQIPTNTKLENGKNNPNAAQREHVKSSSKLYENTSLQMANCNEELADIINNPENLQGYTTAKRNNRKNSKSPDEMDVRDKTKHWEKANERAENYIGQKEKEGEKKLRKQGMKSQKEEFHKISKHTFRAAFMRMLSALLKEVISKLVIWLKSAEKNLKSLIESVKSAIKSFVGKLKSLFVDAVDSVCTTIATSIIGPVVGIIKKTIILLKQGWQSIKEAVQILRKPENKGRPLSYVLPQVGICVITGLSGVGAIALGNFIEGTLMSIPFLAVTIPLLGSPASLIGTLMGAIVCGIIGAIAINIINKHVVKKQKDDNLNAQIDKKNEILEIQDRLLDVKTEKLKNVSKEVAKNVSERHKEAAEQLQNIAESVLDDSIAEKQNITNDELDRLLQEI